jgi:hypothetical protein
MGTCSFSATKTEHPVPGGMAVSVVDLLEMIDIDQKQREEPVLSIFVECTFRLRNEGFTIENTCERVALRLGNDLSVLLAERTQLAAKVEQRCCQDQDRQRCQAKYGRLAKHCSRATGRNPEEVIETQPHHQQSQQESGEAELRSPVKPAFCCLVTHQINSAAEPLPAATIARPGSAQYKLSQIKPGEVIELKAVRNRRSGFFNRRAWPVSQPASCAGPT